MCPVRANPRREPGAGFTQSAVYQRRFELEQNPAAFG
jgi:hypothetical protein